MRNISEEEKAGINMGNMSFEKVSELSSSDLDFSELEEVFDDG
jgi:hypothetical protein